jgi:hypothetical protein
MRTLPYVPDDLANLERDMADTYFLNFSLFQSLPDSWAINQLFPVLPLHRLNEQPTRHAVLADITCDSDGKIDRFIDLRDVKRTLELHPCAPTSPTTWASSWWAPTRRSWATCTTCSATRTSCTSIASDQGHSEMAHERVHDKGEKIAQAPMQTRKKR